MNSRDDLSTLAARFGVDDTLHRAVLVVDDDRGNLTVLQAFLEAEYTVYEAESGTQALEVLAKSPVDVVVADQRMPGMSGVELLERLKVGWPDVTPILLTAYTDTPVLVEAINRAGVFRHMRKPWEPDDLLAAVAQASAYTEQKRLNARLVVALARRSDELTRALEELRSAQGQMLHMERLSTLGRVTAGITHDLRNTLVELMYLESQLEIFRTPARLLDPFRIGVSGMRDLLETLTTLHQFAAGAPAGQRERLRPAELVQGASTVARMEASVREVLLSCWSDEELPTVRGDRPKLVQALVNLVRHGMQMSEARQTVSLSARREPDGMVCFSVEHPGQRLGAERIERRLDPYETPWGDSALGMGLYMAAVVAEQHRGSLLIGPREGGQRGQRLDLRIPSDDGRSSYPEVERPPR